MHIPDGFVSGEINLACAAAALGAVGISSWRATREVEQDARTMPLLATTGAFVFAAQMLNFPVGFGTSGHFLGAAAIAALLGPWRACLVMTLVLVIQALVFGDGGLSALGTNIVNMGIVASATAYGVMRLIRALLPAGRGGYLAAVALASWVSVVLAAGACAVELALSGTSPLVLVLPAMVGTHAVIGAGEALITCTTLSALLVTRPDLIPDWARVHAPAARQKATRGAWGLAAGGFAVALVLACLASPWASQAPDGLERVAEQQAFDNLEAHQPTWPVAALPEYSVPGLENQRVSTSLAGLVGTAAMFAVGFCAVRALGRRKTAEVDSDEPAAGATTSGP